MKFTVLACALTAALCSGAASLAQPQGETGLVLPDLIKGAPTDAALWDAWPAEARSIGLESTVTLRCVINLQGKAEDCVAENEGFAGMGFGPAARRLIGGMTYEPGKRDGKPTAMSIQVSVPFRCGDRCKPLDRTELRAPLLLNASWKTAPTMAEVAAAYPPSALAEKVEGSATLMCKVARDGDVTGCKVTEETPVKSGFGDAARALSAKFTMAATSTADGGKVAGSNVRLPFRFRLNAEGKPLVGGRPDWKAAPSDADFLAAFPIKAVEAGVSGRGTVNCVVNAEGGLENCSKVDGAADEHGFAEAALSLTPRMRMSIWSTEGLPTIGSRVRVPVVFNLKTTTEAEMAEAKKAAPPTVLTNPDWSRKPTGQEVAQYFPNRAAQREVGGQAEINCKVKADGNLEDCVVQSESPVNYGFGDAAVRMARLFRMRPMTVDGQAVTGARVTIPIYFGTR